MARPRRIDKKLVARAKAVITTTTDLEEFRCAQAVLLPALFGATLEQTAAVLGVGRATVPRLQSRLPQAPGAAQPCPQLGRTPEIPPHPRGRSRVLKTVAGKRCARPFGGRFPDSGRSVATSRPTGQALGGLPLVGTPWLAKGGARHAPSQEQA